MAEKSISNSDRVIFPKGKQHKFLQKILKKFSIQEIAKECDVSVRTIRDWRREKFTVDLSAVQRISKKAGISFPKYVTFKKRYWYTASGSSAGGIAVFRKYGEVGGNPKYRKRKWREWWEKEGRYKKHPIIGVSKPIQKPRFSSELAEFVGILLGDGGISRSQIVVSLNSIEDRDYAKFVTFLIKKLFHVPVGIYMDKHAAVIDLVISRVELVRFCVEKLELKIGNKVKQQVDVPEWIKKNKQYLIACTRGLVDTDGSVFSHRYKVNGKWYAYPKISFSNRSVPLLKTVLHTLTLLGMKPRITRDEKDVRIESQKDVKLYFDLVGTSNVKYLKKYMI